MWPFKLVNFPFGVTEIEVEREDYRGCLQITSNPQPHPIVKESKSRARTRGFGEMSLKEDALWALFDEVENLSD